MIAQVCICEPITGNVSSKEKEENQDREKLKNYLFIVFFGGLILLMSVVNVALP